MSAHTHDELEGTLVKTEAFFSSRQSPILLAQRRRCQETAEHSSGQRKCALTLRDVHSATSAESAGTRDRDQRPPGGGVRAALNLHSD